MTRYDFVNTACKYIRVWFFAKLTAGKKLDGYLQWLGLFFSAYRMSSRWKNLLKKKIEQWHERCRNGRNKNLFQLCVRHETCVHSIYRVTIIDTNSCHANFI